jgi:norsolorinic acid ketoreductase
VIANAGIADSYGSAAATPIDELQRHLSINTVGVVVLFQAVIPLLNEAVTPKFVILSSAVASLSQADKIPLEASAYGASKVAVNFIVRKIHQENERLIAFPISPG